MDNTSPVPVSPPPGWLRRNLLWVALGGGLAAIVVCVGCFGGLISVIFGVIKASDVYRGAVAAAQQNPEVKSRLGEPITPGFLVTGQIKEVNNSGTANLEIPISGPKGSAKLHVAAEKRDGKWKYSKLQFEPDDASLSGFSLLPLPADPTP
jgi:hypothetical protein